MHAILTPININLSSSHGMDIKLIKTLISSSSYGTTFNKTGHDNYARVNGWIEKLGRD